jgi:hypothetical protein
MHPTGAVGQDVPLDRYTLDMIAALTVIGGALAAATCATGSWAVKRSGQVFAARLPVRWSRAPAG